MRTIAITTLIVLSITIGTPPSWASASDSYAAGIRAFKSGDYSEALADFDDAFRLGMDAPTLHYNLGATHFKLGDYPKAAAAFSAIESDPEWGALAQYNLGLIAEKMGHRSQAKKHFRAAKMQASSDKLRLMADARLKSNKVALTASAQPTWNNYLAMSAGFDDNVMLADDATLESVSGEEDYFAEVVGFASRYVHGNFTNGWRFDLGGYYRAHSDLNDFDFGSASAAIMYNRLIGEWHIQGGFIGDVQLAGGDFYTSGAGLRLRAYHPLGAAGLRLTNDLRLIEGAAGYDYLSGTQNRLTVELTRRLNEIRCRGGYQFEVNDRDDLALTHEYFNYSPMRHGMFGVIEMPLSERLTAEARAAYRISDYDKANVEIEPDGTVIVSARDEGRLSAALQIGYRVAGNWELFAEYEYNNNDSKIDRYSYASNRYQIGIQRQN